jgi:hypothetical protein
VHPDYTGKVPVAHVVTEGAPGPFPFLSAFVFRCFKPSAPETAWIDSRGAGRLIVCDCIQSMAPAPGSAPLSSLRIGAVGSCIFPLLGFKGEVVTPPMFFKLKHASGTSSAAAVADCRPEYARLFALRWDALVFAHGNPVMSGAKATAAERLAAIFGSDLRPAVQLKGAAGDPDVRDIAVEDAPPADTGAKKRRSSAAKATQDREEGSI